MIPCTRRDFDSDLLGLDAWALALDDDAGAEELRADVLAAAALAGARAPALVSARVPEDGHAARQALEAGGFVPVEVLVTLRAPTPGDAVADPRVRRGVPADAPAGEAVARAAFTHDRYHTDPRVDDGRADDLKAAWVGNDLRGRADRCFVVDAPEGSGTGLAGFNLCLRSGDEAVIDLIAVAPGHQGQGLGRALVHAALRHYADLDGVLVGTQATNAASLSLYRTCGFTEVHRQVTYHLVTGPVTGRPGRGAPPRRG